MTQRAFKYRLYPDDAQAAHLSRTFGAARFVWNRALALRNEAWEQRKERLSSLDAMLQLTQWKKTPELSWLNDISAVTLQQVLRNQDVAFKNFFDSCTGKRPGPKVRYPRFKNRGSRKSLRYVGTAFRLSPEGLHLAKITGPIRVVMSRLMPDGAVPSSATVSCDATGRWFVSLLVDTTIADIPLTGAVVGIDLGLKNFAITSDGDTIAHPKTLHRHAKRLARYQRVASRRAPKPGQPASKNYVKAKRRVAKVHAKVADTRNDFLHKTSTAIVRTYDIIAVEDLNVAGMVKNHRLAKTISDSGWAAFRTMLTYKSDWYGKRLIVIDRWHPSSRLCSECGWKNSKLKLSDRSWTCLDCGTLHDRDINAAKNIMAEGLSVLNREVEQACGEDVRPKRTPRVSPRKGRQPSVKQEPDAVAIPLNPAA